MDKKSLQLRIILLTVFDMMVSLTIGVILMMRFSRNPAAIHPIFANDSLMNIILGIATFILIATGIYLLRLVRHFH